MKQLCIILLTAAIFITGCTTTSNVDNYIVSLEQSGLKNPDTFFIVKGNNNDYINNIDFKNYSDYLSRQLEQINWTPSSYGEADVFLFFEYGIDAFYSANYKLKPKYNEDTNVTSWVHKDSEIERMTFIRITAADAEEYRLRKKQSVRWDLLVREPENTELSETAVADMIDAGVEALR